MADCRRALKEFVSIVKLYCGTENEEILSKRDYTVLLLVMPQNQSVVLLYALHA